MSTSSATPGHRRASEKTTFPREIRGLNQALLKFYGSSRDEILFKQRNVGDLSREKQAIMELWDEEILRRKKALETHQPEWIDSTLSIFDSWVEYKDRFEDEVIVHDEFKLQTGPTFSHYPLLSPPGDVSYLLLDGRYLLINALGAYYLINNEPDLDKMFLPLISLYSSNPDEHRYFATQLEYSTFKPLQDNAEYIQINGVNSDHEDD